MTKTTFAPWHGAFTITGTFRPGVEQPKCGWEIVHETSNPFVAYQKYEEACRSEKYQTVSFFVRWHSRMKGKTVRRWCANG